jgi:hypothetical protein
MLSGVMLSGVMLSGAAPFSGEQASNFFRKHYFFISHQPSDLQGYHFLVSISINIFLRVNYGLA